jgi:hypothetical protein
MFYGLLAKILLSMIERSESENDSPLTLVSAKKPIRK